MPTINTNLIVGNDDAQSYPIEGDSVLKITHLVSPTFYIHDDDPQSYQYESSFTVTNKLKVPLSDVAMFLSASEDPDQKNVKTKFLQPPPDGGWDDDLMIQIGNVGAQATSTRQSFTIQIRRTIPGNPLDKFTLKINFDPVYTVDYTQTGTNVWSSEADVIPKSS